MRRTHSIPLHRLIVICCAAGSLAIIIPPLRAQTEPASAKSAPPAPTEIHQTLTSGLRVIVVERPPSENAAAPPLVAIDLRVRTGSSVENPAQSGIAHFIEHLVFKGTDTAALAKPGEIDTRMETMGGELLAATSKDWTRYGAVVPLAEWSNALTTLSVTVLHPAFRKEDIEREQRVVVGEIGVAQAEANRAALAAITALTYSGDDPNHLSIYGTTSNIRCFDTTELARFHRQHYVPGNMTLVVVGAVKAADVVKLASALFPDADPPAAKSDDAVAPPADLREIQRGAPIIRPDRKISTVALGFLAPSIENPDAVVVCDVLMAALTGNGDGGRLYEALVRKPTAPALAITGEYQTRRAGNTALAALIVTVPRGSEKRAETLLIREIERVREDGFSESEVENAKDMVLGRLNAARSTVEGEASHLAFYDAINGGTFAAKYAERVRAIRAADLQAAVIRYLPTSRYTTAVIAPIPPESEPAP